MTLWEGLAIVLAGGAAGMINAVVGSGTLVTFPTLLALGYPPVVANVSNNIGLVVGGVAGAWGYRRELAGQRTNLLRLVPMSLVGSVAGALLLLRLPEEAFETVVPVLIALSVALVILQPRIARAVASRRERRGRVHDGPGVVAAGGTLAAGVYGGYFGAAQGVLLVGMLGALLPEPLQRVNALKNVLSVAVNAVASLTFLLVRPEAADPAVIVLIAAGSLVGGWAGAGVGRRLPAVVLRGVIVVVGVTAVVSLLAG